MAAQPLRFERAEHDPAILEDDRVQGHAEVQMADALDVAAVVVHDEQLQGEGVGGVAGVGRLEGVAVADEDELAAGQRARARGCRRPSDGSGVFDQSAAPVFGVKVCCVSCTILRVGTWTL